MKKQDIDIEKEHKKQKKKHKGIKRFFLIVLLIILLLLAYFIIKVYKNGGGLKGIVTTVVGSSSEEIMNLEDIYILCLGKSQDMTDTIMVLKYDPQDSHASLLSIPRDSFVGKSEATASPSDKINSKFFIGPQAMINSVNELTGLNIKYYVTVDTKALRDLVDAIGGVYFDVPIDMDYDDCTQDLAIHLKAGYQLLNGEQAEGVVRFRHNNNGTSYSVEYGDNDLGRMKTQREFITQVLKQTMKASNITKINQLMNIAKEEVETNIPWDVIKNYIATLLDFNTENLKTDALPGTPQYLNGYSFMLINKSMAYAKVKEMFLTEPVLEQNEGENNNENQIDEETEKPTPTPIKNSTIKLEVINATANTSKYTKAITQLQSQGYKISKKGTANPTAKTIVINRTGKSKEVENAIKSLLCTGVTTKGEDNNEVDLTIIIGMDY